MAPSDYLWLVVAGFVAGVLNVIAGGGSFLTLPLLIWLGLPPTAANATNRVGILIQNVGAVWRFDRHGLTERSALGWAALPACVGALGGVWLAMRVGDDTFRRSLALLMVGITIWTLWDPLGRRSGRPPLPRALVSAGFLLVGIYGGYVQAGVGFLVLALTTLAGYDLVRGNAIKVLCILAFTLFALVGFAAVGQVRWLPGLALGVGTFAGGQLGVRWTVARGHRWLRWAVSLTVIAFAVRLWIA